ncbi:MAG: hypothetical protein LBI04_02730 [Treponema sp.]|nr:hypothetical protein [Treponema sp.]
MTGTEINNLEYISGAFKGLSAEKQDSVLDTARSLLKIQGNNDYSVNGETTSHSKKEERPRISPYR